jgi:hypothetical protein
MIRDRQFAGTSATILAGRPGLSKLAARQTCASQTVFARIVFLTGGLYVVCSISDIS